MDSVSGDLALPVTFGLQGVEVELELAWIEFDFDEMDDLVDEDFEVDRLRMR